MIHLPLTFLFTVRCIRLHHAAARRITPNPRILLFDPAINMTSAQQNSQLLSWEGWCGVGALWNYYAKQICEGLQGHADGNASLFKEYNGIVLELAFQTSPERGVQNEIHLPQWLRDVCEDVTNKQTKPEGSSRALAIHLVLPLHPHCQDMTVVDSFKGKSFSVNSLNQTQQMKFSMHTTAAGKRIWQNVQSRLATRKSHLFVSI